ncbi:MAG TPA: hypothetical protein VMK65_06000, partial [Longimicrobiales bacterium]|nr:hypothetical protein [Longimicrobiales bacterium]
MTLRQPFYTVVMLTLGALAGCVDVETEGDAGAEVDTLAAPSQQGGGAEAGQGVMAHLADAEGRSVGTATLTEEAEGVRVAVQVSGLEPGPK